MERSQTIGKISAALLAVQRELRPVIRNKSVEVDGPKARWDSRYATFAQLSDACRELLAKNGVAVVQGCVRRDGHDRLETMLVCGDEWLASDFPIKASRDGAQGFGGGISFARRWGLACMVGLVSEDDAEERRGYADATREPKRPRAPAGLAELLRAIDACKGDDDLPQAAAAARAAFPTGQGAADVEGAIDRWFVRCLDGATLDDFLGLRELANRVKPRGAATRDALRRAAVKLEPP